MKYVCIEKPHYSTELTIGKIYECISESSFNIIWVIDDSGKKDYYGKSLFKDLNKVREEKLNKILFTEK